MNVQGFTKRHLRFKHYEFCQQTVGKNVPLHDIAPHDVDYVHIFEEDGDHNPPDAAHELANPIDFHNPLGQFLVNLKEKQNLSEKACLTVAVKMQCFVNVACEQLAFRVAQHNRETGDTEVRETGDTEVRETGDSEVRETGDSEVRETGDSEVRETGDTEVRETGDTEVRETGDTEVRETSDIILNNHCRHHL